MPLLRRSIPYVLGFALAVSAAGLLARVWFEIGSGYLSGDALIFQTVGRGILNGITPWSGLFETKPPLVFILPAVSLKLFGDQALVKIVQGIVLLLIPIFTVLPAVLLVQEASPRVRRMVTGIAALFGILMANYAGNQAGYALAESHGAGFGVAFIAVVAAGWLNTSWRKQSLLLGVLLLLATGFKEPFVFSILGGTILFTGRWSDLGKTFVVPVLIAAVVGVLCLLLLGWFGAFFGTYLPHMLGFHVFQHDLPVWIRALELHRYMENAWVYSPFFAMSLVLLWVAPPVLVWMRGGTSLYSRIGFLLRWAIGTYVTLLSVAMGGDFYGHHFIFALPFYVALFLYILPHVVLHISWKPERIAASLFAGLLVLSALMDTQLSFADLADHGQDQERDMRTVAALIDDSMDRCGYDRYLQLIPRGGGPFAYTEHSPYGPIFVHYARFIGANKEYQRQYLDALQEAPLMLLRDLESSNLSEFAQQYVRVHYTENPPACAGERFEQPVPYHVLFRQE